MSTGTLQLPPGSPAPQKASKFPGEGWTGDPSRWDHPTNFIPNAKKRFGHKGSAFRELCTTEFSTRAGQSVLGPAAPLPPPGRSSGTSPGTDPAGVPSGGPLPARAMGTWSAPPQGPSSCFLPSAAPSGWIQAWSDPTESQHPPDDKNSAKPQIHPQTSPAMGTHIQDCHIHGKPSRLTLLATEQVKNGANPCGDRDRARLCPPGRRHPAPRSALGLPQLAPGDGGEQRAGSKQGVSGGV